MATLYITEYANMAAVPNNAAQMAMEPAIASQTVAIGASSVQSATFNAATRFVRLHVDTVASIALGTNPTAAATSGRLATNQTEYRGVPQGGGYCVAVIANS